MFDTQQEFVVQIYSGGHKECVVRWPTDELWKRRAKQVRIKNETIGRDRSKSTTIGAEAAALELFEKIRVDKDGPEFDAAEALEVLDRISYIELCPGEESESETGIDLESDQFVIRLAALMHKGRAALNGMVHRLKQPTMRQQLDYKRACVDVSAVRRGTEMVQPLAPGEALYDQLIVKKEGYANGVPVIHKDFVVYKMLEAIRELEEDDRE